jgi:transcriptional regulator with XRE-family HTH domain
VAKDYEMFWLWVQQQMEARDLTWYTLEKAGGVSNAAISRLAREWRKPTVFVCQAIARGLRIGLEDVLRQAGYLPSQPTEIDPRMQATVDQLLAIWHRLSEIDPDALDRLLNVVVMQAEMVEATARVAEQSKIKEADTGPKK